MKVNAVSPFPFSDRVFRRKIKLSLSSQKKACHESTEINLSTSRFFRKHLIPVRVSEEKLNPASIYKKIKQARNPNKADLFCFLKIKFVLGTSNQSNNRKKLRLIDVRMCRVLDWNECLVMT